MNYNMFPPEYNAHVDEESRKKEQSKRQSFSSLSHQTTSNIAANNRSYDKWTDRLGILPGLSPTIAFIACVVRCEQENDLMAGIGSFFVVLIITVIVTTLVSFLLKQSNTYQTETAQNSLKDSRVQMEEDIIAIQKEAEQNKRDYYEDFEKKSQEASVDFAESEVAKEVIDWLTDGFIKNIDAANRQNYVEQILVPFEFEVFFDNISSSIGTYDFEEHRCSKLATRLKQSALCRAIASSIQLNIVMKYEQDISGTKPTVRLDYDYSVEAVRCTITYLAPNGNYKAIREW